MSVLRLPHRSPHPGRLRSKRLSAHSLEATRGDRVWVAGPRLRGRTRSRLARRPGLAWNPRGTPIPVCVIPWPFPHSVRIFLKMSLSLKDSPATGRGANVFTCRTCVGPSPRKGTV